MENPYACPMIKCNSQMLDLFHFTVAEYLCDCLYDGGWWYDGVWLWILVFLSVECYVADVGKPRALLHLCRPPIPVQRQGIFSYCLSYMILSLLDTHGFGCVRSFGCRYCLGCLRDVSQTGCVLWSIRWRSAV